MTEREPEGPLAMFHRLMAEDHTRMSALKRKHPSAERFVQVFAALPNDDSTIDVAVSCDAGFVSVVETLFVSPRSSYNLRSVSAFDLLGASVEVRPRGHSRFEVGQGAVRFRIQSTGEINGVLLGWRRKSEG